MRRAYIVGTMTLAMIFAAIHGPPAYGKAADSARNFRHHFSDLKNADNGLNPLERFALSLMLANSAPSPWASPSDCH